MTTTQHTPGDWDVCGWQDLTVNATTPNGNVCTIVLMTGGDAYRPAYEHTQLEEWQANARLIAAAPDLLAAAKRMVAADEALAAHPANDTTKVWDRLLYEREYAQNDLKAAIAKAEGRS